jgi:ubiquinone/menaquinone biosynthesis C-methylase UbiE
LTQIPNWRELMVYNPPVQQRAPKPQSQPQGGGADKFHGAVAEGYDAKRESTDKWKVEQRIIEGMLAELPAGTSVFDCPVGTGRFLHCYVKGGLDFVGMDIQGDMLVQAALKLLKPEKVEEWVQACNAANTVRPLRIKDKGILMPGDIRQTGLPDKHVDVTVACRITRWMIGNHGPEGIVAMLRELQRITRSKIIVTARVYGHRFAVTEDLITSALDGWKITRNVPGYEMAYRIIMLEPA